MKLKLEKMNIIIGYTFISLYYNYFSPNIYLTVLKEIILKN